jgi:hypothetical protein
MPLPNLILPYKFGLSVRRLKFATAQRAFMTYCSCAGAVLMLPHLDQFPPT